MHNNPRRGLPAFTLIELMAVITIIVILAALVVGGLGFVTDRQAKEKAKVQIALLSKSLEDYKLDMGEYPPTSNKGSASASSSFSGSKGISTSNILFDYLYFDSDRDGSGVGADEDQRIYLAELDPLTNKQGWTSGTAGKNTKILDPWGNEYCYRTAKDSTGKDNSATINPDFDLWSMGKNGKTRPNDRKHADSADDIWNP